MKKIIIFTGKLEKPIILILVAGILIALNRFMRFENSAGLVAANYLSLLLIIFLVIDIAAKIIMKIEKRP